MLLNLVKQGSKAGVSDNNFSPLRVFYFNYPPKCNCINVLIVKSSTQKIENAKMRMPVHMYYDNYMITSSSQSPHSSTIFVCNFLGFKKSKLEKNNFHHVALYWRSRGSLAGLESLYPLHRLLTFWATEVIFSSSRLLPLTRLIPTLVLVHIVSGFHVFVTAEEWWD